MAAIFSKTWIAEEYRKAGQMWHQSIAQRDPPHQVQAWENRCIGLERLYLAQLEREARNADRTNCRV